MKTAISRHGERGFTLLETMVVIGILGIVARLSVPGMLGLRDNLRIQGASTKLQAMINFGRSEAVRTGRRYVIALKQDTSGDRAALYAFDGTGGSSIAVSSLSNQQLDGTASPPAGMVTILSADIPSTITFGPAAGFPGAFSGPYNNIAHTSWCNFCGANIGAIYFESDGTLTLSDGNVPVVGTNWGGALSIVPRSDVSSGRKDRIYAITLIAATGGTHVWR